MTRIKQNGQTLNGVGGGWHRLTFKEPGWVEFHRETGSLRSKAGQSTLSMTGMLVPDAPNFCQQEQKSKVSRVNSVVIAITLFNTLIFLVSCGINLREAYRHHEARSGICSQK